MAEEKTASVCIVGAGSMGILTGYHLALAGAAVTFLVRPHHRERLSRPQRLYSYDDHSLKTYAGYDLMTDPAELEGANFDFVVITLDGGALRAAAGESLVDAIGRAFRGTATGIVIGSMGIDLRSWFLERSGLAETQVTNGVLANFGYEVARADIPRHPSVDADLLAQADYAYRHNSPFGFGVDLSAPQVAHGFAELYDRCGVSKCVVMTAQDFLLQMPLFALLMGMEQLGWPRIEDIDPAHETWQLSVEAMREFQRLSFYGPAGIEASERTSAESAHQMFLQIEENSMPLDMAAFSAYHHGGKVNGQDHQLLREALALGEAEGADMPALRGLVARFGSAG